VGYVSASHFARRLLDAVRENAIDAFRDNYCHWDVLILDDIQFLGGRVEAQEEFFHIFNVLHQQGRQIIIASDKAPDRLGLLEQRLVSRFAGGIVAELKPPEWETRLKILHRQASEAGADLSDEVLSLIATRVSNDVRKMNGALRKVLAYAKLVGKDLNSESAEEILRHLGVSEAA
jgi:chromosomal replication initiator protein